MHPWSEVVFYQCFLNLSWKDHPYPGPWHIQSLSSAFCSGSCSIHLRYCPRELEIGKCDPGDISKTQSVQKLAIYDVIGNELYICTCIFGGRWWESRQSSSTRIKILMTWYFHHLRNNIIKEYYLEFLCHNVFIPNQTTNDSYNWYYSYIFVFHFT